MMDETETVGLGQLADKVAALARQGTGALSIEKLPKEALPPGLLVEAAHVLVIRDGEGDIEVKPLAPYIDALRGKPARRKGTAVATTLQSFCALVDRGGDADTALFLDGNWRAPKLTAVLNYNLAPSWDVDRDGVATLLPKPAPEGDDPLARFGDHRVVYAFPLSEPWKAWIERNGKPMSQGDFATFLEDHIHEIAAESDSAEERRWKEDFRTTIAAPNDLVDLARGLQIHVDEKVKARIMLSSGETEMSFETEHRSADGGKLTVPGLFILNVPVFYRGEAQRMLVRLRYRVKEGALLWFYEIFRPDEFVDRRVRDDVARVEAETGLPVYDGAPEA